MSENQQQDLAAEDLQEQQPVATRTRRLSNTNAPNALGSAGHSIKTTLNRRDAPDRYQLGHNVDANRLVQAVTIYNIVNILNKDPSTRSEEEIRTLEEWSFLVPEAEARLRAKLAKSVLKQRALEQEESFESIKGKAAILAKLIEEANYIVIYTGAGISTSASIPDYRGPNGLWTQIKKTGTFSMTKTHDLTSAEPTLTHMAIRELCRRRIVNHVVSQNCDGLHLRSGIPQSLLSEIHGNMYIEVCPTCERQYFRQADVTERTSRFRHKTGRKCHNCPEPNNNLIDTIVLYGERSRTKWPMNWERADKAAKRADLIICMGSSLKTLRRYSCLWPKSIKSSTGNKSSEQTKLAIINLQYTSKDKNAVLKINGKCDLVMQLVMQMLNIQVPAYDWSIDPLHHLATPFRPEERAELKRNLIFESKAAGQSSSSPASNQTQKKLPELSKSPSLFVSELTDDPEKKRLRMRIRAVADVDAPTDETSGQDSIVVVKEELPQREESEPAKVVDYALPGWLGKSLGGGSRARSGYRRKRHGNKGRKHSSVLKPQQSKLESEQTAGATTILKSATDVQSNVDAIELPSDLVDDRIKSEL